MSEYKTCCHMTELGSNCRYVAQPPPPLLVFLSAAATRPPLDPLKSRGDFALFVNEDTPGRRNGECSMMFILRLVSVAQKKLVISAVMQTFDFAAWKHS